jgi:hypothetical protein
MTAGSLDLVVSKRLLDAVKGGGFRFQRVAPATNRPLWGAGDPRMAGHHLPRRVQPDMDRHPHPRSSLIVPDGPWSPSE